MKNLLLVILLAVVTSACNNSPASPEARSSDTVFNEFKERFMDAFWNQNPSWAASLGKHEFDGVLVIPNEEGRKARMVFTKAYQDSLAAFSLDQLSPANQCDFHMIKDQLESTTWYAQEYREWEWNPAMYNLGEGFAVILSGRYAPLDERLRAMAKRMENVPAYYEAGMANISDPTESHTNMAVLRNRGTLEVFGASMIDSVHASGLSETEKRDLLASIEISKIAVSEYIDFLENVIKPGLAEGARGFRIGKKLFSEKFDIDIRSRYTAEEVYNFALESKDELHVKMFDLTATLWPKYFEGVEVPDSLLAIRKMIDRLSLEHVHRDSFQYAIEQQIPELMAFVREHDLVYLDPEKPLVVRREPAYLGGFAVASISAPGPYDKFADTYYNVGPLDGFTDEQAESYLREYNNYVLQILNIHEAIPGHYAQLVYANMSPSVIKSVFGNGAMIEGWAVYTERMMLEEGYNNSPEMWLLYYKWNMRVVCNTILDYSIHVNNWTKKQGLELLIDQAFQQEAEANGKWRRATLSQVQLCSYYTGFKEIYDLRDEIKAQEGEAFDLRSFHEELLSFGSAPVKYVRDLMLNKKPI